MIEVYPIVKGARNRGDHYKVVINLILNYGLEKIAEIGVYKGKMMRRVMRSGMVPGVKEWYGIDSWESNEYWYPGCGDQRAWDGVYLSVCKYMPWFPALRVIRSKSVAAASLFQDGYFDMVYLDGDHTTAGVLADGRAWLPKVRKGGLIAGHDYAESGKLVSDKCDVAPAVKALFGKDYEVTKCSVWYRVVR